MQLRFSTLASSTLLLLSLAGAAQAQQSTPAPKVGYVRFWDMLPPTNGKFEVRKVGAAKTEGSLFSATAYRYSSYTELAVGMYKLGVFKAGERENPLKVFDVNLKPDTFFTILLSPKGGVITAELIDDTNDPKATSGTLTIRNYFAGTTVAVSTDKQKVTDGVPYGESYSSSGFSLSRLPLTLKTNLKGVTAESGAEADFTSSTRATVLIIPDSYGRFRPRTTIDGKN